MVCKVTLLGRWGEVTMGPGYEKEGLLLHGSCDEREKKGGNFILYKRVYCVFQVAFVASIYRVGIQED
jgi:hypothetical protein